MSCAIAKRVYEYRTIGCVGCPLVRAVCADKWMRASGACIKRGGGCMRRVNDEVVLVLEYKYEYTNSAQSPVVTHPYKYVVPVRRQLLRSRSRPRPLAAGCRRRAAHVVHLCTRRSAAGVSSAAQVPVLCCRCRCPVPLEERERCCPLLSCSLTDHLLVAARRSAAGRRVPHARLRPVRAPPAARPPGPRPALSCCDVSLHTRPFT